MIVEVVQNVQMKVKVRHAAGKFYAIRIWLLLFLGYIWSCFLFDWVNGYTKLLCSINGNFFNNLEKILLQASLEFDEIFWDVSQSAIMSSIHTLICRFVEGMAPVFSRSAWLCAWHLIQVNLWFLSYSRHPNFQFSDFCYSTYEINSP